MEPTAFQGKLLPYERILWSGAPVRGFVLSSRDIFLIPFSLLWCWFVVSWFMGVASFGAGVASFGAEVANFGARGFFLIWGGAFLCVGILFLCIGIFMAIGRFVVDAALRKRMAYAVTNKRILISRTGWFPFFTSLDLTSLPDIHLEGDGNARSSLRFGPSVRLYSIGPFVRWYGYGGRGMWVPSLDPTPRFFKIEGAAQVMSLIMKAVEKRRLDDMPPAGAGLSSAVIAE